MELDVVAIAHRWIAAFNDCDIATVLSMVAPNVTMRDTYSYSGLSGPEVEARLRSDVASMRGVHFEISSVHPLGPTTVVGQYVIVIQAGNIMRRLGLAEFLEFDADTGLITRIEGYGMFDRVPGA